MKSLQLAALLALSELQFTAQTVQEKYMDLSILLLLQRALRTDHYISYLVEDAYIFFARGGVYNYDSLEKLNSTEFGSLSLCTILLPSSLHPHCTRNSSKGVGISLS